MLIIKVLLLCPLCVAQLSEISQPIPFQTARLGDSATIECFVKETGRRRVWYKVTTGNRLQLVAEMDSSFNRSVTPQRYSVKFGTIINHLRISATEWKDAGTYFCGVMKLNNVEFGPGTYLMVKGANLFSNAVIQQPQFESVHPGASVTLSCSIRTNHCPAEHIRVVWLKNSYHLAQEIIQSSLTDNNSCQRSETETTCEYILVLRNLSSDDAGTYFCVVTLCGRIQFGNGTKIIIINAEFANTGVNSTFIGLTLSNIILGFVTLMLVLALCMSCRKNLTETNGSHEENQANDAVVYAAVRSLSGSFHPRQDVVEPIEEAVIYSKIRDF